VARLAAKQQTEPCLAEPVYYVKNLLTFSPSMARLTIAHGPFLARLVFLNEKAWMDAGRLTI